MIVDGCLFDCELNFFQYFNFFKLDSPKLFKSADYNAVHENHLFTFKKSTY